MDFNVIDEGGLLFLHGIEQRLVKLLLEVLGETGVEPYLYRSVKSVPTYVAKMSS